MSQNNVTPVTEPPMQLALDSRSIDPIEVTVTIRHANETRITQFATEIPTGEADSSVNDLIRAERGTRLQAAYVDRFRHDFPNADIRNYWAANPNQER